MIREDETIFPQLIERGGPRDGRVHELAYGEHVLGRGRGVSVNLDDPDVSRQHAKLVVAPEGITVVDLGSKNGLFVGGRPIEEPTLMRHGDVFTVGDLCLQVHHDSVRVARALAAAGETTATTAIPRDTRGMSARALMWPALGIFVFCAAIAVFVRVY